MGVFGESGRLGLLRSKETLLLFGEFERPPRRFTVRLGHTQYYNFLDPLSKHKSPRFSVEQGRKGQSSYTPKSGPAKTSSSGVYDREHYHNWLRTERSVERRISELQLV
jgi:hypothetical protein